MTAGPTLEHPLPDGVSDTFTFTCPCEATVHVAGGVEQPHDCPLTEEQKQALRDLAAAELDEAEQGGDQVDEQPAEAHPPGVDPLQLASMLCVNANNALARRGTGAPIEKQIALAQAIATIELVQATRAQYELNLEMAQLAINDRNAAVAKKAGPAGIFVPQLAPGRR